MSIVSCKFRNTSNLLQETQKYDNCVILLILYQYFLVTFYSLNQWGNVYCFVCFTSV